MTNPLENALQRGTFNVLDAARGRGYPTDTVTVFTAVDSAFEAKKIQVALGDETDPDKVAELESRLATLVDEIKASALVFHLRGLNPGVIETIRAEGAAKFGGEEPLEDGDESEHNALSIVAASLVKVVDAEGNEDARDTWTFADVKELFGVLPEPETEKIYAVANELSFASAVFDEVVGPDFSLKR